MQKVKSRKLYQAGDDIRAERHERGVAAISIRGGKVKKLRKRQRCQRAVYNGQTCTKIARWVIRRFIVFAWEVTYLCDKCFDERYEA